MEDAPPYSPTATANERRLPRDYHPYPDEDEEETLMLMRPKPTATPQHQHEALHDHQDTALRRTATAPPTLLYPSEAPPDYAPVDELASSFRLAAPLIYATKTSNTPRYQLMQEFTRSGKPRKLSIRRLLPSESRSHSLPSSSSLSCPTPLVRFDEEATMYTITTYEMRGHRSSTLGGSITMETGKGVLGGKWTKMWQLTRSARRDSLNPENEARMQKYGYHAEREWDKRLLFVVKRGGWEDGEGRKVAVEEEKEGAFEVLGTVSGPRRDLLVSCWVMRAWIGRGMRWEGDVKGW